MALHDERIAWLLTAGSIDIMEDHTEASLSEAAAAGFRAVAMQPSTGLGGLGQDLQARAMRLGMRWIVLDGESNHQLSAALGDAERKALANALSRDGFEGLVLCRGGDGRTPATSLLATARALLRDLDQRDWESHH